MNATGADMPQDLREARRLIADWATGTIAHARAHPTRLRVRLTELPNEHVVLGQLNVEIDGRSLRCQATAPTPEDTGLLLIGSLARKLQDEGIDMGVPDAPDARPSQPPAHPAEITRRKDITPRPISPDAATRWMLRHDYQAHLFIDHDDGGDALVRRDERGEILILRATPHTLEHRHAPTLSEAAALALLTNTHDELLFFTDPDTGRAALLYARYAGGYGLLRPLP